MESRDHQIVINYKAGGADVCKFVSESEEEKGGDGGDTLCFSFY